MLDDFKLDDNELDEIAGGVSDSDIIQLNKLKADFFLKYPHDISMAQKKFVSHVATNYGLPSGGLHDLCRRDLSDRQTKTILRRIGVIGPSET